VGESVASSEEINELLPQTQCKLCGYQNCMSYAQGIIDDDAPLDLCPPGGESTRIRLAAKMGTALCSDRVLLPEPKSFFALIEESDCIGCAKCLAECPTDAIIGAKSRIHTIVEKWCTGCGLCAPVCPVDCIEIKVKSATSSSSLSSRAARQRYERHLHRLEKKHESTYEQTYATFDKSSKEEMRTIIKAAIARKTAKEDSACKAVT
jgi:electron transport complex protein RnfB